MSTTQPTAKSPIQRGLMLILGGPSGTGKSTVVKAARGRVPTLGFSVSHTTRPPRPGERDGVDYHFVDDATFDAMVAEGAFAEWAHVHARRYGTTHAAVEEALSRGVDLVFDIDIQGARQLKERYDEAFGVIILPPGFEALEARLRGRATDTEEQIRLRLTTARHEIAQADFYDYLVVNADLDQAIDRFTAILTAERCRRTRNPQPLEALRAELRADAPDA